MNSPVLANLPYNALSEGIEELLHITCASVWCPVSCLAHLNFYFLAIIARFLVCFSVCVAPLSFILEEWLIKQLDNMHY